jgi:hypothetical protein
LLFVNSQAPANARQRRFIVVQTVRSTVLHGFVVFVSLPS